MEYLNTLYQHENINIFKRAINHGGKITNLCTKCFNNHHKDPTKFTNFKFYHQIIAVFERRELFTDKTFWCSHCHMRSLDETVGANLECNCPMDTHSIFQCCDRCVETVELRKTTFDFFKKIYYLIVKHSSYKLYRWSQNHT